MQTDLVDLTATQALRLMQAGTLRAEELAEACLERIAQREPVVLALAFHDPESVRAATAKALSGPLHGIPFGVKDVLDTAHIPTGYGSSIWAGYTPRADAAPVAWAKAAGMVCYGKTVTTDLL